jgi:hypothetical protein
MHSGIAMRDMSAGNRYPSGRKREKFKPRHAGWRTLNKRLRARDWNWDDVVAQGLNPMLGSVLGTLYVEGVLSQHEASAGRLVAEITARFDRAHAQGRRHAASPAYERSFGSDDEVEKLERAEVDSPGTVKAYERKAKKVKKAWDKLQSVVPWPEARDLLERVCVYDLPILDASKGNIKALLRVVADRFGLTEAKPEVEADTHNVVVRRLVTDTEKRVTAAVDAQARWFAGQSMPVVGWRMRAGVQSGERGLTVVGSPDSGASHVSHTIWIATAKALDAHIDSLFLTACQAKGWADAPADDSDV